MMIYYLWFFVVRVNSSLQVMLLLSLSVLVAQDAVALQVWLRDHVIDLIAGIFTGVDLLLGCWLAVSGCGCMWYPHLFGWSLRLGMLLNSPWEVDNISVRGLRPYWFKRYKMTVQLFLFPPKKHGDFPRRSVSAVDDLLIKLKCCCSWTHATFYQKCFDWVVIFERPMYWCPL